MNDSLRNAEKMWRLGSQRDGIPLMQKENTLLATAQSRPGIAAPSTEHRAPGQPGGA